MRRFNKQRQSGSVAVEFAYILPLVFLLVLGFIEFGNLFYSWLTTYKAAQDGARFAATGQGEDEGTRMSQIQEAVARHMDRLEGGASEMIVSSWPRGVYEGEGTEGDAGDPCGMVEVTVAYAYHPITPLLDSILPETILLSGSDRKVNEPWSVCEELPQ